MSGMSAPKRSSKKAATGERRKPEEDRKADLIRVRVTAEQKQILSRAADRAGLDLSSWLRSVGLASAESGYDVATWLRSIALAASDGQKQK